MSPEKVEEREKFFTEKYIVRSDSVSDVIVTVINMCSDCESVLRHVHVHRIIERRAGVICSVCE